MRRYAVCVSAFLLMSGVSVGSALGFSGDFEASYIDCDEFAGVGPVFALDAVDALVPDDYIVISPFEGAAIVVAQAGSCSEIVVNGRSYGPAIFAQLGVSVVPPLSEPGQGDFYQLAFATNNLALALRLRILGVNARFTPFMSYEISENDVLRIVMPRPIDYAFILEGPIVRPDPNADPQPTTVFNYFAKGRRRFGNVLQQNIVQGIRFGEGSQVTLQPLGSVITSLTQGAPLSFPFFSAPEVFDRADLVVETRAF